MIPFPRFSFISPFNVHFISSIVILIAFYQFSTVLANPTLESLDLSEDPAIAQSLETIAADLANSTKRSRRNDECGRPLTGRWHGKIVGGNPTDITTVPWQVSIQTQRYFGSTHFCGGTIIDKDWVLTAAHCAKGFSMRTLKIVAGASDIKTSKDTVTRRVVQAEVHPNYSESTIDNDVAMLKVTPSFSFEDGSPIGPVCLPVENGNYVGKMCHASGYGRTSEGSGGGDTLRMVSVPVISNAECNKSYPNKILPSMLCAGYPEGQKDACQGDSGGPLVCENEHGRYEQIGVVSWGIGCARRDKYGVYNDVSHSVPWIKEIIGK